MIPADRSPWPELPFAALAPTLETLQLFSQVAGKVRLAQTPWVNHGWHVTLYVSARGLTTSLIHHGARAFEIEFDLLDSVLVIRTSDGERRSTPLATSTTAAFYGAVMEACRALDLDIRIDETPNQLPDAVPFPQDHRPRAYDPQAALAYWRALVQVQRVFHLFRTRFVGKCSPVHLFWGAFDLAVTRFSGRPAPLHPGGAPHLPDAVTREAYSHEVSSAGFWPGDARLGGAAFYSYAYPSPPAFASAPVAPDAAHFDPVLGEFLLPYDAVRTAASPEDALLAFLETTYEAAADLGDWDRRALETSQGLRGRPRLIA